MAGFVIGVVCGTGELYLLTRLTRAVQQENAGKVIGYVGAKLLLLACAFVPVILFFRRDLLWCGVGVSAALIIGALILNLSSMKKGGGKD